MPSATPIRSPPPTAMTPTPTITTAHIRKKPYQPSITTFFDPRPTSHHTTTTSSALSRHPSAAAVAPTHHSPSPPLPAEIQASLLSVGMRVRKSIRDGHLTHKNMMAAQVDAEGRPFPSTAPTAAAVAASDGQRTGELVPFCGLHRTGFWGVQGMSSSAPAGMGVGRGVHGGVPELTGSQSTVASSQGSFYGVQMRFGGDGHGRKRGYEEEIEEEMDALFGGEEADEGFGAVAGRPERPIARVKGVVARRTGFQPGVVAGNGKVDGDFDDAEFLSPLEAMEVDEL